MTSSLWVAVGASILLVAIVSVDASINTTVALEVYGTAPGAEAPDWKTMSSSGEAPYLSPRGEVQVEANRSDELTFRLVVDHEAPWRYEESFTARSSGLVIGDGTLSAAGGSRGEASFTASVEDLIGSGPRAPSDNGNRYVGIHVQLGNEDQAYSDDDLHASLLIKEVPADE